MCPPQSLLGSSAATPPPPTAQEQHEQSPRLQHHQGHGQVLIRARRGRALVRLGRRRRGRRRVGRRQAVLHVGEDVAEDGERGDALLHAGAVDVRDRIGVGVVVPEIPVAEETGLVRSGRVEGGARNIWGEGEVSERYSPCKQANDRRQRPWQSQYWWDTRQEVKGRSGWNAGESALRLHIGPLSTSAPAQAVSSERQMKRKTNQQGREG